MKKRKWIPTLIIYIILIFVLTVLVFLIKNNSTIGKDINWYRNYYSIVSSIISSVIGITGIILGLFYYFDKERRSKVKILKEEIENYDLCVKKILKFEVENAAELKNLRIKIESINNRIEMMLNDDSKFLQLNDKDTKAILKINSVVDKSNVIMNIPFTSLKTTDRASVLDLYEDSLKNALLICYGELR